MNYENKKNTITINIETSEAVKNALIVNMVTFKLSKYFILDLTNIFIVSLLVVMQYHNDSKGSKRYKL